MLYVTINPKVPYDGRIAYFATQLGRGSLKGNYQRQAWSFLACGGIEIYELPGTHNSIMDEPLLDVTAEALTSSIRKLSTPANVRI
jgi:hypothetical protein